MTEEAVAAAAADLSRERLDLETGGAVGAGQALPRATPDSPAPFPATTVGPVAPTPDRTTKPDGESGTKKGNKGSETAKQSRGGGRCCSCTCKQRSAFLNSKFFFLYPQWWLLSVLLITIILDWNLIFWFWLGTDEPSPYKLAWWYYMVAGFMVFIPLLTGLCWATTASFPRWRSFMKRVRVQRAKFERELLMTNQTSTVQNPFVWDHTGDLLAQEEKREQEEEKYNPLWLRRIIFVALAWPLLAVLDLLLLPLSFFRFEVLRSYASVRVVTQYLTHSAPAIVIQLYLLIAHHISIFPFDGDLIRTELEQTETLNHLVPPLIFHMLNVFLIVQYVEHLRRKYRLDTTEDVLLAAQQLAGGRPPPSTLWKLENRSVATLLFPLHSLTADGWNDLRESAMKGSAGGKEILRHIVLAPSVGGVMGPPSVWMGEGAAVALARVVQDTENVDTVDGFPFRFIADSQVAALKVRGRLRGERTALAVLCALLSVNETVEDLDLRDNAFDDESARLISLALLQNKTVTSLNLSGNMIGDTGAQWLSIALEKHPRLESFALRDNRVKSKGAEHLARGISSSPSLVSVNLSGNPIGPVGCMALQTALRSNKRVREALIEWGGTNE